MAINTQYSYFEIFYDPDIPLMKRLGWAAVSPIAIPVAAMGLLQGCHSSKSSSLPAKSASVSPEKLIDQYMDKCDDAVKRMSEVAACGQFPKHNNIHSEYLSTTSLYIPPDQDQWNVDRLLSTGMCMIKCEWWTPDQPKYMETSGLCEYLLVVPKENDTYSDGSPYIEKTTIMTEQSKAYNYFDYCLGRGYLP